MSMFSSLRRDTATVVEIADPVSEPVPPPAKTPVAFPVQPTMEAEERAEYEAVAAQVGLGDSPALLSEQLRAFLAEENIPRYDDGVVKRYLDKQFTSGGWEWRGLRQADVERLKGWTDSRGTVFSSRRYAQPIPLPVLFTIRKLQQKFPCKLYFFASAPKSNEGDPFLLITDRDLESYIIERWDEPSFRDLTLRMPV